MKTSWVIVDKTTNEGVFEFFNEDLIKHMNTAKYKVVNILPYLQDLNKRIKDERSKKNK